jgi:class 3 adenylate cyclase
LTINSERLSQKYQFHVVKEFLSQLRFQFFFAFLCILVFSITAASLEKKVDQIFVVNFGITACMFALFWIVMTRALEIKIEQFAWLMTLSFSVISAFNSLVRNADHSLLSVMISMLTASNLTLSFPLVGLFILGQFVWYVGSNFVGYDGVAEYLWPLDHSNKHAPVVALVSLISLVGCMKVVTLLYRYKLEKMVKREFIAGNMLQSKSNLTKDLLKLLLPSFVLDQMKSFDVTGNNIDDDGVDAGEVTILFCDIADFDKVIKLKEKEIVRLLDSIFRRFDELCKENGCQKIETVGKTYMACGGLKYVEQALSKDLRDTNPTARVLDLAKKMMQEIKSYEELNLKIGVHKGKCMMGVIGYHKPQFSLIGDAVNTTSRHCTTGDKGHIMVSNEAWKELTGSNVKSRGYTYNVIETEMKGKGMVPVYHVLPLQNLFRKKLLLILERYRSDNLKFPSDLVKIEKIISNTRQELKRKFIQAKLGQLISNAFNSVSRQVNQEIQEVHKEEVHIVRQGGRKKTLNQNRGNNDTRKPRSQTKILQNGGDNHHLVPVEHEEMDSSGSEDEDGHEVITHFNLVCDAEANSCLAV